MKRILIAIFILFVFVTISCTINQNDLIGDDHGVSDNNVLSPTDKPNTPMPNDTPNEPMSTVISSADETESSEIQITTEKPVEDEEKIDYEYLLQNLENPKVFEENKYYRIYEDDNYNYLYIIFDENGNIVESEQYKRCPTIKILRNKLISISLQAGSEIDTCWTFYYDIEKDVLSHFFYGILDQQDDKIIYTDQYHTITVRNIFDKTKLYKTIKDFKKISQQSVSPFKRAEFIDNGGKISIVYLNDNYDEITEIFNLD